MKCVCSDNWERKTPRILITPATNGPGRLINSANSLKSPAWPCTMLSLSSRLLLSYSACRRVIPFVLRSSPSRPMSTTPWKSNSYPKARRSDHTDVYKSASKGEVVVPDPYRWLEEYSEETDQWTTAQEAFTREHIAKYPLRKRIEDALMANINYAKVRRPRTLAPLPLV